MVQGLGAERGTPGSMGPRHLWVPQEVEKGGDAQLRSGFSLGWWWDPQRKRRGLGKGSRTHPGAGARLRLRAPGWGRAGLGEGGSRWAAGAQAPAAAAAVSGGGGAGGGRGSRRRRGRTGHTPTPGHARRAHPQVAALPAGSAAQAQSVRPRGGKAAPGQWGPAAGYSWAAKAVWSVSGGTSRS